MSSNNIPDKKYGFTWDSTRFRDQTGSNYILRMDTIRNEIPTANTMFSRSSSSNVSRHRTTSNFKTRLSKPEVVISRGWRQIETIIQRLYHIFSGQPSSKNDKLYREIFLGWSDHWFHRMVAHSIPLLAAKPHPCIYNLSGAMQT